MKTVLSHIEYNDKKIKTLKNQKRPHILSFIIEGEDFFQIGSEQVIEALNEMEEKELSNTAIELKARIIEDLKSLEAEIENSNKTIDLFNEEIDLKIKKENEKLEILVKDLPETKMTATLCVNIRKMDHKAIETLFQVYKKFGFEHIDVTEKEHFIYYNPETQPENLFYLIVKEVVSTAKTPFGIKNALSKDKTASLETILRAKQ